MTTLGYGDFTPTDSRGAIIISVQTIIGLLIVILILGRFKESF